MPYKNKEKARAASKRSNKKYRETVKGRKAQQLATANWRRAHPEESDKIRRTAYLKKYYNITYDIYQELLEKGNHSCWICQKPQERFQKNLSVDHDHTTGEIRGLLCYTCNRNLIGKHEDPQLFLAAYNYLSAPRLGYIVPEQYKKSKHKRKKS